jgi:hypothetical protein
MLQEQQQYIATLRCIYYAEDDISASIIANACAERAAIGFDREEQEDVKVTSVDAMSLQSLRPEEAASKLDAARNILIKTRARDAFEVAKLLDQFAWHMRHGSLADFDYGHIFQVADALLKKEGAQK